MNPTFKITLENGAVMEGELYPEIAPQSVYNFIDLCNHNIYSIPYSRQKKYTLMEFPPRCT